jgi:hypothetical protein
MNQNNRREFLITLAWASASLTLLPIGLGAEQRWCPSDVNWDEVINDVIGDTNSLMAGTLKVPPIYELGSPHWCMKRALDREFKPR